ncbi:MAG: polysaccharide biosynthesis protein [Lachnospiraceae bacterium]|nr:polysaccharide biosynthesis protein [Lachnospiraceae bacterium]
MGRIQKAGKNIIFGYISNFIILLVNFIQTTVFIYVLGKTLSGVNSVYTDVLSVLSLTELGIGTALNYSLYKPVAERNYEKIKSYMRFYKRAYLTIAGVIAVLGIAITPFLKYILKNPGSLTMRDLTLYYYLFLFNTVISYFVTYKYSLVNAEQKNYIQTNITTLTKMAVALAQISVLLLTRNFLFYLLAQSAVELVQKIFVTIYLNRLYPYLRDRDVERLTAEETQVIVTKTKALICHKIGDVARLQTDTIIISSFVNVDMAAVVNKYVYIIAYVGNFVNIIFDSVISGFGNVVATESREKQYSLFKVYRFFACWLYGFGAVGFFHLLTPFIGDVWLRDPGWTLPQVTVSLLVMDFYLKGGRTILLNFKIASGLFEQDRFLPLIQGAFNLLVSIVLVIKIGVTGVYVGTLLSGVLANLIRPGIIYRVCFDKKPWAYFRDSVKYMAVILGVGVVIAPIRHAVMGEVTILTFALMVLIITLFYNLVFLAVFYKTEEFGYLWSAVADRLPVLKKISAGRGSRKGGRDA